MLLLTYLLTIFDEIDKLSPLLVIVRHLGYSEEDGVARCCSTSWVSGLCCNSISASERRFCLLQ